SHSLITNGSAEYFAHEQADLLAGQGLFHGLRVDPILVPRLCEYGRGRPPKILPGNVRAWSRSTRTAQNTRAESLSQIAHHDVGVQSVTQNGVVHTRCHQCLFRRPVNLDCVIGPGSRARPGEAGINEPPHPRTPGALDGVTVLARTNRIGC